MATRANTNIKKRRYRVLYRVTAAYTEPVDAAAFTTFLATFTELGYCEDKSIKFGFQKGDAVVKDDGKKLQLDYNFHFECKAIQSSDTELNEYHGLNGDAVDLLLYAENQDGRCHVFKNVDLSIEGENVSGELDTLMVSADVEGVITKTDVHEFFDEPLAA